MKNLFNSLRLSSERKKRKCMFSNCSETAIKSHVLQKNGILREISVDNHLIERVSTSVYEMQNKGICDFKKKGINDVYTFQGFCKKHDTAIFRPIESNETLNLYDSNHQLLFSYRGLCQEIRRKEIANEWAIGLLKAVPTELKLLVKQLSNDYELGLKNLHFFKSELERCIFTANSDRFYFETVEIEKIDICISVPLNVGEDKVIFDEKSNEYKIATEVPFSTSFINIFPKGLKSYVIIGYHKDYPCQWTIDFIKKIRTKQKRDILKEISDLITLRIEFWALSPQLFEMIDKSELKKYKKLIEMNAFNHSAGMKTKINLFKNL